MRIAYTYEMYYACNGVKFFDSNFGYPENDDDNIIRFSVPEYCSYNKNYDPDNFINTIKETIGKNNLYSECKFAAKIRKGETWTEDKFDKNNNFYLDIINDAFKNI